MYYRLAYQRNFHFRSAYIAKSVLRLRLILTATHHQVSLKLYVRPGLTVALELLKEIADKYDGVSYADIFQMASGVAIEVRYAASWSLLEYDD